MQPLEEITSVPILYQDEHIIVVHKPSGMMVHPWKAKVKKEPTLLKVVKEQTGLYLYPLHRLDRPVSGAIVFGLTKEATNYLKERWNTDEVEKRYVTLCRGHLDRDGVFDFPLKKEKRKDLYQEASTKFHSLHHFNYPESTFVEVQIKTGRRHQIRRHFARVFYHLIGDTKYGKGPINVIFRSQFDLHRLFLHSYYLRFPHPVKNEYIECVAPLDQDLKSTLVQLGLKDPESLITKYKRS